MDPIKIIVTKEKKEKPDPEKLGFGTYFTDHMFIMDYEEGKGWYNPTIESYGPICLEPSAMVFHYGQSVFEGLKAYLSNTGEILLFRPEKNMERLNKSNERLCIPPIDSEFVINSLKELVELDKEWIPSLPGTSLYIRPFIISTDYHIGVRPSLKYKFMIILSPVGAYYPEGLNPVKIFVESNYVRAVKGGLGAAKTSANYASSLKAQMEAKKNGYTQVLWLDGVEKKYVDEVGTMNVFFKINGEILTPQLNGSILDGVTRDSSITLLKSWGYCVTERKILMQEILDAHLDGKLEEAFGTGTAAVISPIGELIWGDQHINISGNKIGEVSQRLYDTITGIQCGALTDQFSWITKV
jgi:branched-chain amino acid aminotransferase